MQTDLALKDMSTKRTRAAAVRSASSAGNPRAYARFAGLLVSLLLCCMTGVSEGQTTFDYFSVSAPQVRLNTWESVYAFKVDTKDAVILRTRVPFQWDLAIDNSEGGRSYLRANAIVGAAALDRLGFGYFKDFLQIGKMKENTFDEPLEVKLVLTITDDKSGRTRRIVLTTGQMKLRACSEP
jgi:hypothetical protein